MVGSMPRIESIEYCEGAVTPCGSKTPVEPCGIWTPGLAEPAVVPLVISVCRPRSSVDGWSAVSAGGPFAAVILDTLIVRENTKAPIRHRTNFTFHLLSSGFEWLLSNSRAFNVQSRHKSTACLSRRQKSHKTQTSSQTSACSASLTVVKSIRAESAFSLILSCCYLQGHGALLVGQSSGLNKCTGRRHERQKNDHLRREINTACVVNPRVRFITALTRTSNSGRSRSIWSDR